MTEPKIIAVIGATGAQGGGLVRAILSDPSGGFAVRAVTRHPGSDKGKALAAAGAAVVAADLDDTASLVAAFRGAHGVFAVTNFWEHFSAEKELQQATNIAEAAKAAGVRHVIWSTLEDTRTFVPLSDDRMPTLGGKYKVPHFDAKGEADAVFAKLGIPTTCYLTSFYWENFIFFGMGPQKGPDGTLQIVMPMGDRKLPGVAVDDIGRGAYAIFRGGERFIGTRVGIASEHLTGAQMAEAMGKALGQPVRYQDVPPEVFRSFGFPGADDIGNMFQFNRDFSDDFCRARDLTASRQLVPGMVTFDQWLAANVARIPVS
ncbi:MAG: NmrA/HSCARG family protein [Gemmatimonadales bacterium]|nr:NmrA/HSCARG family protein [Gemmatimonadales bacterium]